MGFALDAGLGVAAVVEVLSSEGLTKLMPMYAWGMFYHVSI